MAIFGKLLLQKSMTFSPRPQRENNQMGFGRRAVIEAIRSGKEIESLY